MRYRNMRYIFRPARKVDAFDFVCCSLCCFEVLFRCVCCVRLRLELAYVRVMSDCDEDSASENRNRNKPARRQRRGPGSRVRSRAQRHAKQCSRKKQSQDSAGAQCREELSTQASDEAQTQFISAEAQETVFNDVFHSGASLALEEPEWWFHEHEDALITVYGQLFWLLACAER